MPSSSSPSSSTSPPPFSPAPRTLLQTFTSLTWAQPQLTSPNWTFYQRTRGANPRETPDRFADSTLRGPDGVQVWLEGYEKPAAGTTSKVVTKALSLIKFGDDLHGFPGICHGGAVLALMDEGMAVAMVGNAIEEMGAEVAARDFGGSSEWREGFEMGKSADEVLKGRLVTAKMDVRFLRPVVCPGVVGVEAWVVEMTERKMRVEAVMRDAEGRELVKGESVWIRIGGGAKM